MKAKRYETWGVHLGWAVPTSGGGFIFVIPSRGIEWDWGYVDDSAGSVITSPRLWLEAQWTN